MFGEFLVKQKIITNEQLKEAINAQVIFGGRLGTNLIESGALSEDALEKYLSQYHNLKPIALEILNNIPNSVLKLVPINLVKKLKLIPFAYEDKQLHIVMMDPGRLDAIDELSFVTGLKIKQYVIPEIRFLLLLEKYYGIKRDIRYITLSKHDTAQFIASKKGVTPSTVQKKDTLTSNFQNKPDTKIKLSTGDEDLMTEQDFERMLRSDTQKITEEKSALELSHEMEIEDVLELKKTKNLQEAIILLSNAESRKDIAGIILGYALTLFKRAVVFMIQKEIAIGWEGAGEGVNRLNIKQLMIPLDQPSMFKFVNDTGAHFIGPPQTTEFNNDFFLLLGGMPPKTAVVVPVYFMGRIVQMLYGDNGGGKYASTNIGELLILLQKVPDVIEKLSLKKRSGS
ncbi:MAG: hypothetical protein ACP5JP_05935 [bacterium]